MKHINYITYRLSSLNNQKGRFNGKPMSNLQEMEYIRHFRQEINNKSVVLSIVWEVETAIFPLLLTDFN